MPGAVNEPLAALVDHLRQLLKGREGTSAQNTAVKVREHVPYLPPEGE